MTDTSIAQIYKALELIIPYGSVAELRIPNTPQGVVSGYFNDMGEMAKAAAGISENAPGVYLTLNPVNPKLLARSANHITPRAKNLTSDNDIAQRLWLPIDLDVVRPSGISSTDIEHQMALERARVIRSWLQERGFPLPIMADSGNGAHLLYRIDLPNDASGKTLIQQCLESLALYFTNDHVEIDLTTFNASRIWKLYGTWVRKGDNTPERPHRIASILEAPDNVEIVGSDLLHNLADLLPRKPKADSHPTENKTFDLEFFIAEHDLQIAYTGTWKDAKKWILKICPFNNSHINRSAYIIQFSNGAIAAGCQHNSCAGKDWKALRELLDPEYRANSDDTDGSDDTSGKSKQTQAQSTKLIDLASDAVLFHTPDGDIGFASIEINGHIENWPLKSPGFKRWLVRRYYEALGRPPAAQAFNDALELLQARAQFDSPEYPVSVRIASANDRLFIDLANAAWKVVEITRDGWSVIQNPPVKFRRARGMLPLPYPGAAGSINELFRFVNVTGQDRILLTGAIIQCFRAHGPYLVTVLHGGHGCAKSTTSRVIKNLIDPNTASLRATPKEIRDIMIASKNSACLAYDNLSNLPLWLSDAFCRLATGGGFGTRELYTDEEEVIFDAQRPIIINGIEEIVTQPDLLDRSVILYLNKIRGNRRLTEEDFWKEFNEAWPRILGSLFDILSCALRNEPNVRLAKLPRMADVARWITAAEPALGWKQGTFLRAYEENQANANQLAIEASPVANEIIKFADQLAGQIWTSTATDLLKELDGKASPQITRLKSWPRTGKGISNALRRLKHNLGKVGVKIRFGRNNDKNRERWISVSTIPGENRPNRPNRPQDAASQPSQAASPKTVSATKANGESRNGTDTSPKIENRIDLPFEEGEV